MQTFNIEAGTLHDFLLKVQEGVKKGYSVTDKSEYAIYEIAGSYFGYLVKEDVKKESVDEEQLSSNLVVDSSQKTSKTARQKAI